MSRVEDAVHVKQNRSFEWCKIQFLLTIKCFTLSLDRVAAGGIFLSSEKNKIKTDAS